MRGDTATLDMNYGQDRVDGNKRGGRDLNIIDLRDPKRPGSRSKENENSTKL